MLIFSLFLISSLFSAVSLRYSVINVKRQNIYAGIISMMLGLSFFAYYFREIDYSFILNYKFFLILIISTLGGYYTRLNYIENKNNYMLIKVSVFLTIPFVALITMFLDPLLFDFDDAVESNFSSIYSEILFIVLTLIVCLAYIFINVNKKPDKWYPIIMQTITVSLGVYFSVRLIQEFKPSTFITFSSFFAGLMTFLFGVVKGELKDFSLTKKDKENVIKSYFFYLLTVVFGAFATLLTSPQLYVVYKRTGQLLVGGLMDKHYNDKNINKTDIVFMFILIIMVVIFNL